MKGKGGVRVLKAKNILITGGTSGIGEAVALEFAARGASRIFICGRDRGRLDAVVAKCGEAGADASGEVLDVADADAVAAWIRSCDAIAPLDLVFANAGVSTGEETAANVRRTFDINVGGVVNTVLPAIEIFSSSGDGRARNRRQIAITSSITAYHGLPQCPSYSASKACVKAWGAGLRGMLAPRGIMVNTICPGFVKSRITAANTCPMPFLMEADKSARIIVSRLERNVGLIAYPWPMRLLAWFGGMLPEWLSSRILAALPEKCRRPENN